MKKVLVIDDNEIFRIILADWLEVENFSPILAKDGFEGILLAEIHHPDLIFCDFEMPGMNGIEVLKRLRDDQNNSNTPFFFLTSNTAIKSKMVQQLGANGLISKWGGIDKLREILHMIDFRAFIQN